jgi:hypothetical protein
MNEETLNLVLRMYNCLPKSLQDLFFNDIKTILGDSHHDLSYFEDLTKDL